MEDGLLYIIFVLFALMLVSSKQSDIKQSHLEKSSIEFSIGDEIIEGIVPEFNFSLKKVEVFCFLKFLLDRISNVSKIKSNNHLQSTIFKLYRAKIIGIQQLKKKSFLLITFNTTDKEDCYHLS